MDGFGIGTDNDQIKLLKRIHHWLKPNGTALIDIYTPWYWSKTAGQVMTFNNFTRKYDFDFHHNRMLDTWIRSEEHTSELQSRGHLVCRLLLEKKKPSYLILARSN